MDNISIRYVHDWTIIDSTLLAIMEQCICGETFHGQGASAKSDLDAWRVVHRHCTPKVREGVKTFWLSFCDSDKPKGSQFLGACVVDVSAADADAEALTLLLRFPFAQPDSEWLAAAITKSHRLKCNPGGEVASAECTDAPTAWHRAYARNRLYSRADIERIDAELLLPSSKE